jgi:hypothetical protein
MRARLKYQRRTRWGFVELCCLNGVEGGCFAVFIARELCDLSMMSGAAAIDVADDRGLTP